MLEVATDTQLERRSFLLKLLSSLRVPASEIEDVAHQALLKFFSKGYSALDLEPKCEKALLARIGYSTWVDEIRRKRVVEMGDRAEPAGFDGDHASTARHVQELVALADLDEDECSLLERRFGDGMTTIDIAGERGLHVNTIRRRLARILDKLRRVAAADDNPIACARSGRT